MALGRVVVHAGQFVLEGLVEQFVLVACPTMAKQYSRASSTVSPLKKTQAKFGTPEL